MCVDAASRVEIVMIIHFPALDSSLIRESYRLSILHGYLWAALWMPVACLLHDTRHRNTPGLEIKTANAAEKAPVSVPRMFNFQVGVRKTGKSLARIAYVGGKKHRKHIENTLKHHQSPLQNKVLRPVPISSHAHQFPAAYRAYRLSTLLALSPVRGCLQLRCQGISMEKHLWQAEDGMDGDSGW